MKVSLRAFIVGFNLPLMHQMTGVNGLVTQAGEIMGAISPTLGNFTPLIINIVNLIGTGSAYFLLQKMGRRTNILTGNFSIGITDILLAILLLVNTFVTSPALSIAILIVLIIFMFIYGSSIGPTVWSYVP